MVLDLYGYGHRIAEVLQNVWFFNERSNLGAPNREQIPKIPQKMGFSIKAYKSGGPQSRPTFVASGPLQILLLKPPLCAPRWIHHWGQMLDMFDFVYTKNFNSRRTTT